MIRETANSYGPVVTGKTVEFDLKTLQSLRTDGDDDNATVINLVRAIEREAGEKEDEQPVLVDIAQRAQAILRSEEHTSELQSLMRISYAVFCWKKKNQKTCNNTTTNNKQRRAYTTRQ